MSGDQRADVDCLFIVIGDFNPDRWPVDVRYFHAAPRRQQDPAVGRLDQPGVLYLGRDQDYMPTGAGADAALVAHLTGARCVAKAQASGQKVLVTESERRHHQPGHVHLRALAKHNAVGVDQEYPAIGLQRTQDARGVGAGDPVEYRAGGVLLHKAGQLTPIDAKPLPVDDGAGAVADGKCGAVGLKRRLPVCHLGRLRVGYRTGCRQRNQPAGDTPVPRTVLAPGVRTLMLLHSLLPEVSHPRTFMLFSQE